MQAAYAHTSTYTQTHSIVFLSDNLRNTLREVIRENGLSPEKLMQDWETIERHRAVLPPLMKPIRLMPLTMVPSCPRLGFWFVNNSGFSRPVGSSPTSTPAPRCSTTCARSSGRSTSS